MSRFGKSTGAWEITIDDANINIILLPKDYRFIRSLMLKKNQEFDQKLSIFEDKLIEMITRDNPPVNDQETKEIEAFAVRNSMTLFEEAMVVCRLTTEDEREKRKKLQEESIKKKIENSLA